MKHSLGSALSTSSILYALGFAVGSELIWQCILVCKNRYLEFIRSRKNKTELKDFNEIYFSNKFSLSMECDKIKLKNGKHYCDNEYCGVKLVQRIIETIDNSKSTIDIAMYMFFCPKIVTSLLEAQNRGVVIRIIACKGQAYKYNSSILELSSFGIPVRFHFRSKKLMHHKFCLIDADLKDDQLVIQNNENENEKLISRVVLLGSVNWTDRSFILNNENFIITTNKKLIEKYKTEFNRIWNAFDSESKTNKMPKYGIKLED